MRRIQPIAALVLTYLLCLPLCVDAENHVLSLDGDGDYVEIPFQPGMAFTDALTFEAWILPRALPSSQTVVHKRGYRGRGNDIWLGFEQPKVIWLAIESTYQHLEIHPCWPSVNTWYHIALTYDDTQNEGHLFINGTLVLTYPTSGPLGFSRENWFLGVDTDVSALNEFWDGYMDEVRLWNIARSPDQIREFMHRPLTGEEPDLVGYWQFESGSEKVVDSTLFGHEGLLKGNAQRMSMELPSQVLEPRMVTGTVTDEDGRPIDSASILIQAGDRWALQEESQRDGSYHCILLQSGPFTVSATKDKLILEPTRVDVLPGQTKVLPLVLKPSVSIEGRVLMLDGSTPHVDMVVQAVQQLPGKINPEVVVTTQTDSEGRYYFTREALPSGDYLVRCHVPKAHAYYTSTKPVASSSAAKELTVRPGKTLSNVDFRLAPIKKGTWRTYTAADGMGSDDGTTSSLFSQGAMWFGTWTGLVRYDGESFVHLPVPDIQWTMNDTDVFVEDTRGHLWVRVAGGLGRYDGKQFQTVPLPSVLDDPVITIHCPPDGSVWVGTRAGLFYSESGDFRRLHPDIANIQMVDAIHVDRTDRLWLGIASEQIPYFAFR